MQSQIQSLDIKRPAEPLSRVVASAILIDCPAVAATATAIPFGYFVPTVLTDCCLYRSRSVPLLDLLDLLDRPTCSVLLFPPTTIPTDRCRPTVLLLLLLTDCYRPFRSAVLTYRSTTAAAAAIAAVLTNRLLLFQPFHSAVPIILPTATDRLPSTVYYPPSAATEFSTIKKFCY
jgi:hypothetical protein